MKPYEKYKDSGVPWIGDIPYCWTLEKLKWSVSLITEKSTNMDNYIGLENIEPFTGKYLNSSSLIADGVSTKIQCDDILFGKLRPYLAKGIISKFEGCCSSELLVLRNYKGDGKYLQYLLLSYYVLDAINASTYGAKMPRASWSFIGDMRMTLPSIETQQKIAEYLDQKTSAIDTLIADKQKMIELLKEKRQAIISETVTKGLDKTVPLKDSGIPWIGEIPEVWEIKKVSWIFNEINSGTTPKAEKGNYYDGTIPWLNTGDLTDEYIYNISKTVTQEALDNHSALKIYTANSLVIAMYGATIGKLGITTIPLCTNQACCVMGKPQATDIKYMFYSFLAIRTYLISLAYGGGQPNISQTLIRQLKFPTPVIDTQQKIVKYLDAKTTKIDTTITDVTEQIEKLKEYRQAVISEVVTGKVEI